MKRLLGLLFFVTGISQVNAQDGRPKLNTFGDRVAIEAQNEFYIFGDVAVISNNILSEDDKGDFKKIAYTGRYWTATYAYEKGTRREQKANIATEIVRAQPELDLSYDTKEKHQPYRYFKRGLNSNGFNHLKNKKPTAIAGIEGGYYVVTSVLAEPARAGKWTSNLIKKG